MQLILDCCPMGLREQEIFIIIIRWLSYLANYEHCSTLIHIPREQNTIADALTYDAAITTQLKNVPRALIKKQSSLTTYQLEQLSQDQTQEGEMTSEITWHEN